MPPIVLANDAKDDQFDGVIVVTDSLEHLPVSLQSAQLTLKNYLEVSTGFVMSLFKPNVSTSFKW